MLKKILIGLVVLVAGFFGFAAMQPDSYSVSRKIQIDAPPSTVFASVNSLKKFTEWSPWEKLDPAMKKSWAGPEAGIGQSYAWEGNDKVGKGKMSITQSEADKKVVYALEFVEPFASTAQTEVAISGTGSPVTVEWTMTGKQNLMGKAMGVFMNMDKMMGKDFENGLSNLKTVSEKAAKEMPPKPDAAGFGGLGQTGSGEPVRPLPSGEATPPPPAEGAAKTP